MRIHEVWLHVRIQSLVEKDTEIKNEKKRKEKMLLLWQWSALDMDAGLGQRKN